MLHLSIVHCSTRKWCPRIIEAPLSSSQMMWSPSAWENQHGWCSRSCGFGWSDDPLFVTPNHLRCRDDAWMTAMAEAYGSTKTQRVKWIGHLSLLCVSLSNTISSTVMPTLSVGWYCCHGVGYRCCWMDSGAVVVALIAATLLSWWVSDDVVVVLVLLVLWR